uniref:HPP transmembrane region domain-containing protein n=1 Tax=Hanusia phi TaxID=3032 RepID=A0A7S0EIK8_9CRYP|mmetsp:Transcript_25312/g.57040  ORF Transcript_25312/g.57040 Transcript_25312/m.57040 type:complete len:614 (+) Transcript_25312:74-1915(+)
MSLSPMASMLADTCRSIGFDYAEVWARKAKQVEQVGGGSSPRSRTPISESPQRSPRLMPLSRAVPDRAKLSSNMNDDDEFAIDLETDAKMETDSKDTSQADGDIKLARNLSDDSKRNRFGSYGQDADGKRSRFGSYGIDSDGKRSRFGSFGFKNDDGDVGSLWSAFSGKKGKGDQHEKGGHDKYHTKLRYTGDHFLEDSAIHGSEQDDAKHEALERFLKLAEKVHYTKGEGFPGLAWSRSAVDWHELEFLPDDDELAGDPRVQLAKKLFDVSIGVPVMSADGAHVIAIVMLYRTPRKLETFQRAHSTLSRTGSWSLTEDRKINAKIRELSKTSSIVSVLHEMSQISVVYLQLQEMYPHWQMTLQASRSELMHAEHAEEAQESDGISLTAARLKAKNASFSDISARSGGDDTLPPFSARLKLATVNYFKKFRGQKMQPTSGHDWEFCCWAFIGSFVSLLTISGIDYGFTVHDVTYKEDYLFALIASFGAVSCMMFAVPTSPLIQPRNLLGGHIICSMTAIILDYFTNTAFLPIIPRWIASALAPAIAVAIMSRTGLMIPSAVSCATIYMSGTARVRNLGWLFLAFPVVFDCLIMLIAGLFINNASKARQYPLFW